jgi:hypothetical protein
MPIFVQETLIAYNSSLRSELHTVAVIPKQGVVERSFAWLEQCRYKVFKKMLQHINYLYFQLVIFLQATFP